MTVAELIAQLQTIEDKDRKVKLNVNDIIATDFHIQDNGLANVFMSNYGTDNYEPCNLGTVAKQGNK